jgi:serine/threonine protein phosphatase PrpC
MLVVAEGTMAELGVARAQCHRPYMEDRVVTGVLADTLLVAVFDGHGGAAVAEHAVARVTALVQAALARGLQGEALGREVFPDLDLAMNGCGSTATLLWVRDRELGAAWVGDSRAVLVSQGGWRVLTPDHRIERSEERRRVLAAGAVIDPPYVVDPLTEHGLMCTRALGDRELRHIGITADPEVVTARLWDDDVGFVVATDGLWDVVANEEAAETCLNQAPQAAADRLLQMVIERQGHDNVTIVVGRLGGPGGACS